MVHNPSHLEAANPVTLGKASAKQYLHGGDKTKVLNLQIHGDSAINGQGIVYESLVLGTMNKFNIGGTIHLIINNQIGYSTSIQDSRNFYYSSNQCKSFEIPIIHVNSDDCEAVHKLSKFVVEYR